MNILVDDKWCQIYTHSMCRTDEFIAPPFDGEDYACLLILGNWSWQTDERTNCARRLLETKCRYAVVAGKENKVWVESLLELNRADPRYETPDEMLVMINWCEADDDPEEIVYTLIGLSDYEGVVLRRFLILFLEATEDRVSQILKKVPSALEDTIPVWALVEWGRKNTDHTT